MLADLVLATAGTAQTIADGLTTGIADDIAGGAVALATVLFPLVGGFAIFRWTMRKIRAAVH